MFFYSLFCLFVLRGNNRQLLDKLANVGPCTTYYDFCSLSLSLFRCGELDVHFISIYFVYSAQ